MSEAKKRIVLILILVFVLAAIGLGVAWYLRRNTSEKLDQRARVALRAEKFDHAADLARQYIAKTPDSWRGHFLLGQAHLGLGQFDEARQAFQAGLEKTPENVDLKIGVAESYSLPARRYLTQPAEQLDREGLDNAIDQLHKANEQLLQLQPDEPAEQTNVLRRMAINFDSIGTAWLGEARKADTQAQIFASAGDAEARGESLERAETSRAKAEEAFAKGFDAALKVVQSSAGEQDAGRQFADTIGQLCWRLARQIDAPKRREVAAEAILQVADVMPVAAMQVRMARVVESLPGMTSRQRKDTLQQAEVYVRELIGKEPNQPELKLALVRLMLMQDQPRQAEALCREILEDQATHPLAELLLGRALMAQNRMAEAEDELFRLKTRMAHWPEAHYYYGLAANAAGKPELAKSAMRNATKIDPSYLPARQFLAQSLLREGYRTEALDDARELYAQAPDSPEAILLYSQALASTGDPQRAREVLDKARTDHPRNAMVLAAVMAGMEMLGDAAQRRALAERIVELPIEGVTGRFAAARAMLVLGREAEAESLLRQVVQADPELPDAWYELGRLYDRTRRFMQALESYRKAEQLAPRDPRYPLAVARRLYDSGLVEEAVTQARKVLQIDPGNPEARRLLNEATLLTNPGGGDTALDQQLPADLEGAERSWQVAATAALRRGDPHTCIELCNQQLKDNEQDTAAMSLLADAYRQLGRRAQAEQAYTQAVKSNPARLPLYLRLAAFLLEDRTPQQVRTAFQNIPGREGRLVELAMAQTLSRNRQYDEALAELDAFLARPDLPENVSGWGRLLRAQTLASAGRYAPAMEELRNLRNSELWQDRAELLRGRILLSREPTRNEGEQVLAALANRAAKTGNANLLEQVIAAYTPMQMYEQALAVCETLQELQPREAQPLLLRARLLSAMGNFDGAEAAYAQAVTLQPGNLQIYLLWARLLDSRNRTPEVLAVLKQLSEVGETGEIYALLEKARLFSEWGLLSQAVRTIETLDSKGQGRLPRLQLQLARAYLQLGQPAKAVPVLRALPTYSAEHLPAQLMLMDLAENDQARQALLEKLLKQYPQHPQVQQARLMLLARQGKGDEALAAYRQWQDSRGGQASPALANTAVQIALDAGNTQAAADIARNVAATTGDPGWRNRTILLSSIVAPESVEAMLDGSASSNDLLTDVLGVAWAVRNDKPQRAGQSAARFGQQLQALASAGGMNPNQLLPYRLLVPLALGEPGPAREVLEQFSSVPRMTREQVLNLLQKVEAGPAGQKQAARLLQAIAAGQLQMPALARSLAEAVFQDDPGCLWAAGLLQQLQPEKLGEILQKLRPSEGFMATVLRADHALAEGRYEEAGQLYAKLQEDDPANRRWLYMRAVCLERTGDRAEALKLYTQLLDSGMNIMAANNAAYIISTLYPDDPERLKQAVQWITEVIRRQPTIPAFRDTKGWILHLQGDQQQAVDLLRSAVKGIPDSPEVHYHLAAVEHALGQRRLAGWHVDAAIELGEARKREGELQAADEQALKDARALRERLARTPTPQP